MRYATFLCATVLAAQNWPGFRGPGASGIADGPDLPATWDLDAGRNILWKTKLPGLAFSSPIVWDNRVFVTTAVSDDPKDFRVGLYGDVEPSTDRARHTWKVMALDARTGKVLWDQTAHAGIPRSKRHTKNTQASPTPVTDGRFVVAWFGSEGLFAYTVEGKLAWKKDLGVLNSGWFFDPDYEWGVAASPIIYKGLVILQVDIQKGSFIAAFDVATGAERWRTPREEIPSWGTPNVFEGKNGAELVTNATKAIRAYDPATGKELWRLTGTNFNSETTSSTPILHDGLIYISNGYPPVQPVFAIRLGSRGDISLGEGKRSNDAVAWSHARGGTRNPTPLAYGGLLYTVAENGILTVYDAKTGETSYRQRVAKTPTAHSAAPVMANGRIYLATEDGDVYVIKAGPKFELLGVNKMGEWMMATPAIARGVFYVRTANHLVAIADPETRK